MKSILIAAFFFVSSSLSAQTADGIWYGSLSVGAKQLRVTFTVRGAAATLNSLDRGTETPASSIETNAGNLRIVFDVIKGTLEGTIKGNAFEGTWTQRGIAFPLKLERVDRIPETARPQEPAKPYPYDAEEVTFENAEAKVKLAGTLTKPHDGGPFPAVVLVSGSGPQDRDETVFGHKPFLVLADYLTRRGIAVLRVDDRGVGGSTGQRDTATTDDYAGDAIAAVNFLATRKEIDAKRIGLAGHSEGGMIAPLAATRSPRVTFIVLMAAPGLRGAELSVLQSKTLLRSMGASEGQVAFIGELQQRIVDTAMQAIDETTLRARLREMLTEALARVPPEQRAPFGDVDAMLDAQMKRLGAPWFRYMLRFDPVPLLRKVRVPVLALNGSKDMQVPAEENLAAISAAVRGNNRARTIELAGLNHLFQTAPTGAMREYASIEETFAPEAMRVIADWIGTLR